jgi:hypothetical protein
MRRSVLPFWGGGFPFPEHSFTIITEGAGARPRRRYPSTPRRSGWQQYDAESGQRQMGANPSLALRKLSIDLRNSIFQFDAAPPQAGAQRDKLDRLFVA